MSTNFAERIEYADGTVEIRGPRVAVLGGAPVAISMESDRDGVCRHYGYPGALNEESFIPDESGSREQRCARPTIKINRLGQADGRNECRVGNRNYPLRTIRCHPAEWQYTVPQNHLERNRQPDGSTALVAPWFSRAGATSTQSRIYFNGESSKSGICRHFGFTQDVAGSAVVEDRCEVMRPFATVEVDGNGRVKKFAGCDAEMVVYLRCR